jgi:hypothetical protein
MSMPPKLLYTGFESKRKAITFAVRALLENNLVTPEAAFYYEDYAWPTPPAYDNNEESFDFATWTSHEDEMYYRATASLDDYGWRVVIERVHIPTPDETEVFNGSL